MKTEETEQQGAAADKTLPSEWAVRTAANGGLAILHEDNRGFVCQYLASFTTPDDMLAWLAREYGLPDPTEEVRIEAMPREVSWAGRMFSHTLDRVLTVNPEGELDERPRGDDYGAETNDAIHRIHAACEDLLIALRDDDQSTAVTDAAATAIERLVRAWGEQRHHGTTTASQIEWIRDMAFAAGKRAGLGEAVDVVEEAASNPEIDGMTMLVDVRDELKKRRNNLPADMMGHDVDQAVPDEEIDPARMEGRREGLEAAVTLLRAERARYGRDGLANDMWDPAALSMNSSEARIGIILDMMVGHIRRFAAALCHRRGRAPRG